MPIGNLHAKYSRALTTNRDKLSYRKNCFTQNKRVGINIYEILILSVERLYRFTMGVIQLIIIIVVELFQSMIHK